MLNHFWIVNSCKPTAIRAKSMKTNELPYLHYAGSLHNQSFASGSGFLKYTNNKTGYLQSWNYEEYDKQFVFPFPGTEVFDQAPF